MHLKSVHDKVIDQHCDLCDFKASQSSDLRRHKKTVHFRIKDYECDQCDYKAQFKSSLIEHKRSKHPYTSRSRDEVKPALQKTTQSSIFDEISEEFDEVSEDQESNDNDESQNISDECWIQIDPSSKLFVVVHSLNTSEEEAKPCCQIETNAAIFNFASLPRV